MHAVQEHARQFLHQLMMEKQDRKAIALLREGLDADPAFVPLLPEHGARLAEQARMGGQAQLAVDALTHCSTRIRAIRRPRNGA